MSKRDFLSRCGAGLGWIGLATLLNRPEMLGAPGTFTSTPLSPKTPHFPARAKRVIHFFANGGPSQVDTFDPKPELTRMHGKPLPSGNLKTERKTGTLLASPFAFSKHGQSGLEISELFPNVARCADELVLVRSMQADVPNHEPSLMLMNCGEARLPRPSLGAWVTYGLGTENQNLPGFVSLCPKGYPTGGAPNWTSGFLPGVLQATHVDMQHTNVEKLVENLRNHHLDPAGQRQMLDLVQSLNRRHSLARPGDAALEARIQSFELAFGMQIEATDAFDLTREPKHVAELYGQGIHGRQCLTARRLLERGVRFVQIWHGPGQPWDSHDDIEINHRRLARECDQALGALLTDLQQRGMLEETLVLFGGEFGRTPVVELPLPGANSGKINGRDHNHHGFTVWMAGGGVKGGFAFGQTDPFGFQAVENPVHVHDLHATILHLLGFDHEKLVFRHAGRDFRLTDVHGRVIREILA
jgi:hypothetical protein